MVKTRKNVKSNNKTKKNAKSLSLENCPTSLKPFEEKYGKLLEIEERKKIKNIQTYSKLEFAQKLLSRFSPINIKPNNDFYDYINYLWLKQVTLEKRQKYIVQVDDFRLTQDKVYLDLNTIITDYYNSHNDTLAKNLKKYYTSVINMNSPAYTKKLALEAINIVDNLIKNDNPWDLLAYYNSDEMLAPHAPFNWAISPDDKEPTINRCYITSIRFILLDLNVYYDDGTEVAYKQNYRNKYYQYVDKVFDKLIGKNEFVAKDVFDVQADIFLALGCDTVTKKEEPYYNKVYTKDALSKYGFDWEEFSTKLGFKKTPDFFIASSLNFLKCGSKLFVDNWKTPKWRTYWIYLLFGRLIRITKGWEDLSYDFFGKFERGQEEINKSDAVSSTLYMTIPFNSFLTKEYVKKFENPHAMKYAKTICNGLKIVYKRILKRNKWMQPSTKKYALKKLDHFNFIFGKPEHIMEDPNLTYETELYDNMQIINKWRHDQFIKNEGHSSADMPMVDWTNYPVKMSGTQAYIVNACYTPAKNSIYVNLGYIQKPFVDLDDRGIEYNLATIGYTIGHEMSHGFDDSGSQYGLDGKLFDWWTAKDKIKYKNIQKDIIKQYEEFAARDKIKFDASIGIGEDLADISGLAICEEFLRDFQENNKDIIPIRELSFEAFYTYNAIQQKQVVNKNAISSQLKTNPHPLNKYRCNVPLSRSVIFRSIYNVKKGDGMWWHNTDTVW